MSAFFGTVLGWLILATTGVATAQSSPPERSTGQPAAGSVADGERGDPVNPPTSPIAGDKSDLPSRDRVQLQAKAIESVRTSLASKRTSEALRVAERTLREFPDNPQLRFLYGVALTDSEQKDQAISVFYDLTRDHPELAEPYNNLAVLHASTGDLKAARDALEQAIVAVPGYTLAHENLGDLYVRLATQAYEQSTRDPAAPATARRKLVLTRGLLEQLAPAPKSR